MEPSVRKRRDFEAYIGTELTEDQYEVLELLPWYGDFVKGMALRDVNDDVKTFVRAILSEKPPPSVRKNQAASSPMSRQTNPHLEVVARLIAWQVRARRPRTFQVIDHWFGGPRTPADALKMLIEQSRFEAQQAGGAPENWVEPEHWGDGFVPDETHDPIYQLLAEWEVASMAAEVPDQRPSWPWGAKAIAYLGFPSEDLRALIQIPCYKINRPLDRIRRTAAELDHHCHWQAGDAVLLLLCGAIPPLYSSVISLVRADLSGSGDFGPFDRSAAHCGLSRLDRVRIEVDPSTSPSELARIYSDFRRENRINVGRGRPTTPHMLDMAEFAFDPVRSHKGWKERMKEWNQNLDEGSSHKRYLKPSLFRIHCERTLRALVDPTPEQIPLRDDTGDDFDLDALIAGEANPP